SPLAPMQGMDTTTFIGQLIEHIYIGIGTFYKMGLPKYLGGVGLSFKASCTIKTNLAGVGALLGHDLGNLRVEAGVRLSGIPGSSLPAYLGVKGSVMVDLWLIKVRVNEM
ncbi:MAG TPA: hypothetical protein VLH13_03320, partial [Methanomassiliicoccales archaeon]|nr:hypothetical protein [Methanomassiliicoccales archaeon]